MHLLNVTYLVNFKNEFATNKWYILPQISVNKHYFVSGMTITENLLVANKYIFKLNRHIIYKNKSRSRIVYFLNKSLI